MQFPFGYKINSSVVILRHHTSFLLLKRQKEPFMGYYVPVGGKLEPHESPIKAAIRETYEETGLQIPPPKFCGVLVETSPVKLNWTLFIYMADIAFLAPPPCTEGVLSWVEQQTLTNLQIPETDYYIYEYVLKEKPFMFNAEYDSAINLVKMTEEIENKILFSK